jgi:tetratricopeptide (TPR) repeat protein
LFVGLPRTILARLEETVEEGPAPSPGPSWLRSDDLRELLFGLRSFVRGRKRAPWSKRKFGLACLALARMSPFFPGAEAVGEALLDVLVDAVEGRPPNVETIYRLEEREAPAGPLLEADAAWVRRLCQAIEAIWAPTADDLTLETDVLALEQWAAGARLRKKQRPEACAKMRCLLGDLVGPVTLDPLWLAWSDRSVVRLAETIHQGQYELMPCEYDQAIADLTEPIRLEPTSGWAYGKRGYSQLMKKEYQKAIDDFTEAIQRDPDYAQDADYAWAHANRGDALLELGLYARAIADLNEAVRIEPESDWINNLLAWALASCPADGLRDGKRAVALATKACELTKWKDATYLDTLAAAHAECGDFAAAVKWQQHAIALDSNDAEAQQRLRLFQVGQAYRGK